MIAQHEGVIDVFVALSPAFERLRNPGMRKVMSRLVTVEQAARMAGVNVEDLVARLNDFVARARPDGSGGSEAVRASATGESLSVDGPAIEAPRAAGPKIEMHEVAADLPPAVAAIPPDAVVHLDVREELRAGREPFSMIMAALRRVPAGGALTVRAIFEPVPLYTVMKRQGLEHWTERLADDDWRTWFHPAGTAPSEQSLTTVTVDVSDLSEQSPTKVTVDVSEQSLTKVTVDVSDVSDDRVVVLDVRGLEPPEPMVRTLAALEVLPAGGTLVQLNERVPRFILPLLEERGYSYEVSEQGPGVVRVFIRRSEA